MKSYKYQSSNLMYAIESQNSTLLKKYLDVYPPCSMKSGLWYNLMQKAVRIGKSDIIQLLVWDFHVNNQNKHPSETPLHTAVLKDNLLLISSLLNEGVDVNCKDELGNAPLHFAINCINFDAVRLLLNYGCDVNVKNNLNVVPLNLAAYIGNLEIFEYLLNQGATINTVCTIEGLKHYTPVHLAAISDSNHGKRMIELLIEKGADVNAVEENGFTALHLAISEGRRPVIDLLLKHANFNIENRQGISPLCVAAFRGDFRTVSSLINFKVNVNLHCDHDDNSKLFTPLHLAAKNGSKETIQILLKNGANIEARNANDETALHVSIHSEHIEAVELLLRYGADVNSVSSKWQAGFTSLHLAIASNNKEMVELLIREGADVFGSVGMLPIHYATINGNGQIIKILLDNGIYVDTLDKNGKTPLNIAIDAKKSQSIELILKYCPNLKCQNHNDLLDIIDYNDKTILAMLFKHGVKIKRENINNKSLISAAIELGFVNIMEELFELEADPNTILNDELNYSMIHVACKFSQKDIAELLIKKGAYVNFRDHKGKTPLFFAAHNDNINIIQLLLKNYADINAKSEVGQTALYTATRSSYDNTVKFLLNNGADINCNISFALDEDTDEDDDLEYNDYDHFIDRYYANESRRKTARILKKHIIKLKSANLPVADAYLSLVDDEWGLIEKCKKEVETMKNDQVHSKITYYSLLTKNVHNVAIYLKNVEVKNIIQSCNFKEKYPSYWKILTYRCEEAIKRNQLLESEFGMYIFNIFPKLPYFCIDEIFSYLDNSSLQTLIIAVQPGQEKKICHKTKTSCDAQEINCDILNKKIRL